MHRNNKSSNNMKTQYLTSCSTEGLHHLAYTDWGNKDNPNILVCSHGLTRNKHDFDALANKLSTERRVICFDLPGRGESDWLNDKSAYDYKQYIVDALMIIARTGANKIDWLGTSMGGLLGMMLASLENSPIKSLILNDVGPFIPKAALIRIANYVGKLPYYDTAQELENYMRTTYAGFGDLSDEQWKHLLRYGQKKLDNGQITLNYDPGVSLAFNHQPIEDIDLWSIWNNIQQRALIIRGENSDLLARSTTEQMLEQHPNAEFLEIPNTAHSPALMNNADNHSIEQWLDKAEPNSFIV
jgi:pimeloyl-ACP methyl ester carboxylesterase